LIAALARQQARAQQMEQLQKYTTSKQERVEVEALKATIEKVGETVLGSWSLLWCVTKDSLRSTIYGSDEGR